MVGCRHPFGVFNSEECRGSGPFEYFNCFHVVAIWKLRNVTKKCNKTKNYMLCCKEVDQQTRCFDSTSDAKRKNEVLCLHFTPLAIEG